MEIDARGIGVNELLIRIKELLASKHACSLAFDVLTDTIADARKGAAFVSMSGCSPKIDKINNHYIIHITGTTCCT